ncbi:uncharacterized protein N7473_006264 [Penicillium subrubescens]|uniref:uncharacterized protein n=1 Tax=Penicillium subrubescens TaxID=1316194 RepID=UPI0025458597|nr:uncharacterized protein N7473_006264 [Penicillium subrubescens]KAJ5896865.1 hypothetical protein N7473_006264 [Penicillium subrubescens]
MWRVPLGQTAFRCSFNADDDLPDVDQSSARPVAPILDAVKQHSSDLLQECDALKMEQAEIVESFSEIVQMISDTHALMDMATRHLDNLQRAAEKIAKTFDTQQQCIANLERKIKANTDMFRRLARDENTDAQ